MALDIPHGFGGGIPPDTEPVSEPKPAPTPVLEAGPELAGMLKAELLALAQAMGISGVSAANTKNEIIAAIEAAKAADTPA